MPNTIAQNLQRLITAKGNIATAIRNKGGTVASGDGLEDYASDIADIPNTYAEGDEGKVVSSGALVAQSSSSTSSNGTVDTTLINSLAISVPTYSAADNGKVVQNGELVVQSTHKPITANATGIDTTNYSSVDVTVPNSYAAGDEGKVVQSGALVAQTTTTKNTNGTYDTTTINSVTVSVPTYSSADNGKVIQSGALTEQGTHKSITSNDTGIDTTYYASVDVAVPNSYAAGDEGKVVSDGALVVQSVHKSISTNGTGIDTTTYSSVDVAVPNTYTAGDEGKVVSNGALVAQTAYLSEITANDTYDTTNYNSVTVNVPSASDAYKLSFTSSAYRGIVTGELYSINSNSSTSVFGYFVLKPTITSIGDSLTFSFDSAFTPSFTSKKLDSFSGLSTGRDCYGGIDSTTGKYIVNIIGSSSYTINAGVTYTIYIQTLFV